MKILVTIMFVLAAVWCKGMPSTNTFAAVTNDWYNANFTNVYELAQPYSICGTENMVG